MKHSDISRSAIQPFHPVASYQLPWD